MTGENQTAAAKNTFRRKTGDLGVLSFLPKAVLGVEFSSRVSTFEKAFYDTKPHLFFTKKINDMAHNTSFALAIAARRAHHHQIAHHQKLTTMRCFILACSTMLMLLGGNCRKDGPVPIIPPDPGDTTTTPVDTPPAIVHVIDFGKSLVTKNNTVWVAETKAYHDTGHPGMFVLYARKDQTEEQLVIFDIPTRPGKYSYEYSPGLSTYHNFIPQVSFYISLDQDQLIGAFSLDTTRTDNFIEVVRYDSVSHIVEGLYRATLLNKSSPFPGVPNTISLTNGRFHLKIDSL